MSAELVRYDGNVPYFTETVTEFAVVIDPLLGLSGLVAKVMASRVETGRTGSGHQPQHPARPTVDTRRQATVADHRSQRAHQARIAELAVREQAQVRRDRLDLTRLEQNFDAALCAIKMEGASRQHEADRRFAAEIRRIDSALQIEMTRLAEVQRRNQQSFVVARQRLRMADAARRDIGMAMSEATRLMRGRNQFAEIAALTVPALSQAMVAVVTRQQDGTSAILESLCKPQPRRIGRSTRG